MYFYLVATCLICFVLCFPSFITISKSFADGGRNKFSLFIFLMDYWLSGREKTLSLLPLLSPKQILLVEGKNKPLFRLTVLMGNVCECACRCTCRKHYKPDYSYKHGIEPDGSHFSRFFFRALNLNMYCYLNVHILISYV